MPTKRLNFDVTPEQEAEISALRDTMGATTTKDTLLRAVRILRVLSSATQNGGHVYLRTPDGETQRLVVPELATPEEYRYLVFRPHVWRRQPWVKGTRILAATIWRDMATNTVSATEAAVEWDLPLAAVQEAVSWCEAHRELLELEALEERRQSTAHGISVGAAPSRG